MGIYMGSFGISSVRLSQHRHSDGDQKGPPCPSWWEVGAEDATSVYLLEFGRRQTGSNVAGRRAG